MNIVEVREIAKKVHVKYANVPKAELIKTIQISEGNFDCFATATNGECDQLGCAWRKDCFKAAQSPHQ